MAVAADKVSCGDVDNTANWRVETDSWQNNMQRAVVRGHFYFIIFILKVFPFLS